MAKKRLGELLLEHNVISRQQLEQALAYQRQTGMRLGAALVALKFISELQLCAALAAALGMQAIRMPPKEIDWPALHVLRARFCEANDVFPVLLEEKAAGRRLLTVAMADPLNFPAIEEMEFTTGLKVVPVIAPLSGVREAIRRYYMKQHPDPHPDEPEKMTIIRPGGVEDVVITSTESRGAKPPPVPPAAAGAPKASPRPPPPPARMAQKNAPAPDEDSEPVRVLHTGEYREVTERTALADLIEERARRRQKKCGEDAKKQARVDYLLNGSANPADDKLEKLERRFWALLRIMAKKGLISREEFLQELTDED